MALWMSNSISQYYYFQQVLVKWFMKRNITENPHCTRHGSLDSGSWSHAWMRLRLLTALLGRALQHTHTGSMIYSLQNMGRSGTRQISPTFTAQVLYFRINSCTATCQIKEKEFSPQKWLRIAVIMSKHFIFSCFRQQGFLFMQTWR